MQIPKTPCPSDVSRDDDAERQRAADEIRLQKTLLENQTEASPDGILTTSMDWTIRSFNRRLTDMWGIPGRLTVGTTVRGAMEQVLDQVEDPAGFVAMIESFAATQDRETRGEVRLRDGRTFALYSVPTHGDDGTYFGRVTFFRDVTDTKRAQDELQRLSHRSALILNSAGDGIIGLDPAGIVTFANPGAARMTGYAVDELIGRQLHGLLHHSRADGSPYPFDACPISRVLASGTPRWVTGDFYWRKDGTSFPVEYVGAPIPEGEAIVGVVITFKDISERRAVERMKDEFISVVSHELRTPLTSIRGSLGLLAGGLMGPLPTPAQHMLDIAVKNTDRLVNLINDILDIERIESGAVTMQRRDCDAADLMTQAGEVMQGLADKAGVTLSVTPLPTRLFADPDRIVQVLTNLLSNAIKFSYRGGSIWLDATREPDQIRFRVRDEGRGIPTDKLEKIFERFQQVDTSDAREKGGTGLGLAICRSIAHQHGGRIWAETGPATPAAGRGPGSTFFVTLPTVAAGLVGDEPLVLVCDDDAAIREAVQTLLEAHGYRAIAVASGEEAIARAAAEQPRVILLDLIMPGMNGWETVSILKERPATRDIPIVILSVLGPGDSASYGLPVVEWVTKPLNEASLVQALGHAVGESAPAPRALIVEDDADLAQVLIATFQRLGVETFHAQTGRDAISLSQRVTPSLLVLDLVLPDGDGFAVVDWLRRHDHLRQIPLIVYSARDLTGADRSRLKLGSTEFLTKGRLSSNEFEDRVIALLNSVVPRGTEG